MSIKRTIKSALAAFGYEIHQSTRKFDDFVPYIENYELMFKGSDVPCIFQFWISNSAAEKWYKEWFYSSKNPTWELQEFSWLVSPGDQILEIGCHHGFLTMMLEHLIGPKGKMLAVDPNPENTMIAMANIQLNKISNVEVICAAAGEAAGIATLEWRTNSHVIFGPTDDFQTYEATVTTCDELDRIYGPFNVLKVDVEGFEGSVLRGCKALLQRKPKLILELHPNFMLDYGYGDTIDDILDIINPSQYEGTIIVRPEFDTSLRFDPSSLSRMEVTNLHLKPK